MRDNRPLGERLLDPEARRELFGQAIIFLFTLVMFIAFILVMLWLSGVWPDKLIPWLPFERI